MLQQFSPTIAPLSLPGPTYAFRSGGLPKQAVALPVMGGFGEALAKVETGLLDQIPGRDGEGRDSDGGPPGGGVAASQSKSAPALGSQPSFGAGKVGGALGTALSIATKGAVPGLGTIGGLIGTAVDIEEANAHLTPRGFSTISAFSAFVDNLSFGLFGESPRSQYTAQMGVGLGPGVEIDDLAMGQLMRDNMAWADFAEWGAEVEDWGGHTSVAGFEGGPPDDWGGLDDGFGDWGGDHEGGGVDGYGGGAQGTSDTGDAHSDNAGGASDEGDEGGDEGDDDDEGGGDDDE